jgi:hypothetical protein
MTSRSTAASGSSERGARAVEQLRVVLGQQDRQQRADGAGLELERLVDDDLRLAQASATVAGPGLEPDRLLAGELDPLLAVGVVQPVVAGRDQVPRQRRRLQDPNSSVWALSEVRSSCADQAISGTSVTNSQPITHCRNSPDLRFWRAQITQKANDAGDPSGRMAKTRSRPSSCCGSGV